MWLRVCLENLPTSKNGKFLLVGAQTVTRNCRARCPLTQELHSAAFQERSNPEFLQPSTAVSHLRKSTERPSGKSWCPPWVAGVAWGLMGVWGQSLAFLVGSPPGLWLHTR